MNENIKYRDAIWKLKKCLNVSIAGVIFSSILLSQLLFFLSFLFMAINSFKLIKTNNVWKKVFIFSTVTSVLFALSYIIERFAIPSLDLTPYSNILNLAGDAAIEAYSKLEFIDIKYYYYAYICSAIWLVCCISMSFTYYYFSKGLVAYTDRFCNSLNNDVNEVTKKFKIINWVIIIAFVIDKLALVLVYNACREFVAVGEYTADSALTFATNFLKQGTVGFIFLPLFIWYLVAINRVKNFNAKLGQILPLDSYDSNNTIDVEAKVKNNFDDWKDQF